MTTKKWVADCSKFPTKNNCDIMISGTDKDEVTKVAVDHAINAHGFDRNEPGLYESVKSGLEHRSV